MKVMGLPPFMLCCCVAAAGAATAFTRSAALRPLHLNAERLHVEARSCIVREAVQRGSGTVDGSALASSYYSNRELTAAQWATARSLQWLVNWCARQAR